MLPMARSTLSGLPRYPEIMDAPLVRAWPLARSKPADPGWRTGGASAPTPAPGTASGVVYIGFAPSSPDEVLLGHTVNVGNFISCAYYPSGLGCDIGSIPTNTTFQFTVSFRTPMTLGTYTCRISAVAFQGGSPWTEYNPDNNATTVSYWVGYWA